MNPGSRNDATDRSWRAFLWAWSLPVLLILVMVAALLADAPWAMIFPIAPLLVAKRRGLIWSTWAFSLLFEVVLVAFIAQATLVPALADLERAAVIAGRLTVILGANLVFLQRIQMEAWMDQLRLPLRWMVPLSSLLLAVTQIERAWNDLKEVHPMPASRLGRVRHASRLLVPLLLLAMEEAKERREALHQARLGVPILGAGFLAMTALAMVGRMAFVAIPNVALTYLVVFAAGYLFGMRVGFLVGFFSMLITDLLLSGLLLLAMVNVPAMAALGLLGGALRVLQFRRGSPLAFVLGFSSVLVFSTLSDGVTWLVVPELRAELDLLLVRLASGYAFNLIPAVLQGILFAVTLPTLAALQRQGHQDST